MPEINIISLLLQTVEKYVVTFQVCFDVIYWKTDSQLSIKKKRNITWFLILFEIKGHLKVRNVFIC